MSDQHWFDLGIMILLLLAGWRISSLEHDVASLLREKAARNDASAKEQGK